MLFSTVVVEQRNIHIAENETKTEIMPFAKVNTKWIKPNYKMQNQKLLEDNVEENEVLS